MARDKYKRNSSKNRSRSRSRSRDRKRHDKGHTKQKKKYRERSRERDDRQRQRSRSRSKSHRSEHQQRGKYYKAPAPDPDTVIKELPCFEPSGILLQFYNSRQGVAMKFHEPPEAKEPTDHWRMYPFKDDKPLQPILLAGQSCFLLGKDQRVCDILLENPSISRQHAVIQFRQIKKMTLQGHYSEEIKPYVMDLESSNGTLLNEQKIPPSRYVQLLSGDRLKFGSSQRQYVFIKEEEEK